MLLDNYFIFKRTDGLEVLSNELGKIKSKPAISRAVRVINHISIEGRNGTLTEDTGSYNNIEISISLINYRENILDKEDIICISPDEGAMKRARFFSEVLDNAKMGSFYKYRSQQITDGNGQIKEHRFLGEAEDLIGRTAIVTDDMIDTGGSILDTAKQLKELGADKVYLMATFAFFSKGIEKFNKYYECGYFDKVYSTNLVYVSSEVKNQPWFELVDCSYNIAYIISELNYGRSIGEVIKGRDDVLRKVRKVREERGRLQGEIK